MPYVEVKVAGNLSKDQKENIANDIAMSLHNNAGKAITDTYIVFQEVARENWAKGTKLLA